MTRTILPALILAIIAIGLTVETIDIGITDQFGNKIMARRKMDPVGFVRFSTKD